MAKKKSKPKPPAKHAFELSCDTPESFNVAAISSMFDCELGEKTVAKFEVETPPADGWNIGAVVGASGSGKSSVAAELFGDDLYQCGRWPKSKAIVDCLGKHPLPEITKTLATVGFSSPPDWVKPYAVLSNGQKFRCDLAKALLAGRRRIVFDEFTSVVDRNVARIGSAAVAKAVRKADRQFIAVSCHYDILPWLEPDWVIDMNEGGALTRRRLRRPKIEISLHKSPRRHWRLFEKAHYLNPNISSAGRLYVALWNDEPVGCVYTRNFFGRENPRKRPIRTISRLVVLPDFQGVGIGGRLLDAVASIEQAEAFRLRIVTAHPSMFVLLKRSVNWKLRNFERSGFEKVKMSEEHKRQAGITENDFRGSVGRPVLSAEYVGD